MRNTRRREAPRAGGRRRRVRRVRQEARQVSARHRAWREQGARQARGMQPRPRVGVCIAHTRGDNAALQANGKGSRRVQQRQRQRGGHPSPHGVAHRSLTAASSHLSGGRVLTRPPPSSQGACSGISALGARAPSLLARQAVGLPPAWPPACAQVCACPDAPPAPRRSSKHTTPDARQPTSTPHAPHRRHGSRPPRDAARRAAKQSAAACSVFVAQELIIVFFFF